ncbi:Uncharacterised protein [uncultured archaeon]|nr:Uncharacterised protein [uncultured archaeon]
MTPETIDAKTSMRTRGLANWERKIPAAVRFPLDSISFLPILFRRAAASPAVSPAAASEPSWETACSPETASKPSMVRLCLRRLKKRSPENACGAGNRKGFKARGETG